MKIYFHLFENIRETILQNRDAGAGTAWLHSLWLCRYFNFSKSGVEGEKERGRKAARVRAEARGRLTPARTCPYLINIPYTQTLSLSFFTHCVCTYTITHTRESEREREREGGGEERKRGADCHVEQRVTLHFLAPLHLLFILLLLILPLRSATVSISSGARTRIPRRVCVYTPLSFHEAASASARLPLAGILPLAESHKGRKSEWVKKEKERERARFEER